MSDLIPQEEIAEWLRALVIKGGTNKTRETFTLGDVARYTGIPRLALQWFLYNGKKMSEHRQRQLSRMIALVENGQIKVRIRPDRFKEVYEVAANQIRPPNAPKYAVRLGPKGPTIEAVPRPAMVRLMPDFKTLIGKPKAGN